MVHVNLCYVRLMQTWLEIIGSGCVFENFLNVPSFDHMLSIVMLNWAIWWPNSFCKRKLNKNCNNMIKTPSGWVAVFSPYEVTSFLLKGKEAEKPATGRKLIETWNHVRVNEILHISIGAGFKKSLKFKLILSVGKIKSFSKCLLATTHTYTIQWSLQFKTSPCYNSSILRLAISDAPFIMFSI